MGPGPAPGQALSLDRPLEATEHLIYVERGTPPSDASEWGLLTRIARVANVPFGFECDEQEPREAVSSTVEVRYVTGATLRQALDAFVALDPRYQWKDVRGVLVVRTMRAWTNPGDPLNHQVQDIHWADVNVYTALNRLAHLLYPGDSRDRFEGLLLRDERTFTVEVRQGTVIDALNAAARADGELGWWARYGATPQTTRFALTLGHYGNGPSLGWPKAPTGAQR
jgi:hypothetical protein